MMKKYIPTEWNWKDKHMVIFLWIDSLSGWSANFILYYLMQVLYGKQLTIDKIDHLTNQKKQQNNQDVYIYCILI